MFMRVLGKFLILIIRCYQIALSPLSPPCCRFYPTCSEYAMTAILWYGPFKGTGVALMRLLRCHPLGRSGYDPLR